MDILNTDIILDYSIDRTEHINSGKATEKHSAIVPNIKELANLAEGTAKDKLRKSVEKYKRYLSGLNDRVPTKIQTLFNDLSKQYLCEWKDEDSIYFTEFNMYVRPPYGPENCEGGSNEKAKQRVKHILSEFAAKFNNLLQ